VVLVVRKEYFRQNYVDRTVIDGRELIRARGPQSAEPSQYSRSSVLAASVPSV
jgi:hypothetical protein